MTHAQERIMMGQNLRRRICDLLGWDLLQFAELQYSCGCQYLQHYIPNDPAGIDELLQHKMYWNWWKNQWQNRDYAFLAGSIDEIERLSIPNRRLLYQHLHDSTILAKELSPNGIILAGAYKKMIGKLIKEETI